MIGLLQRIHRWWSAVLWRGATCLASVRRTRVPPRDVEQHIRPHQTRGMGLRMSEFLRDRLRPGWVRLRRDDNVAD